MDETATMASFQQSRSVQSGKRKFNSEDEVAEMVLEKKEENGTEPMDEEDGGRRTRRRRDEDENHVEVSQEIQNMNEVRSDRSVIAFPLCLHSISSFFCALFLLASPSPSHLVHERTHTHTLYLSYHIYTHIQKYTITRTQNAGGG